MRSSYSDIINSIYFLFCMPSTLKNVFEEIEMQKLSQAFVWIFWCRNGEKLWCLYNINQHYPKSIRLKQQRKRIGMFMKMRKANKVVTKIIAVLKCYVFQCFSTIIHSETLHVFRTSYSKPIFIMLCDNG